MFGRKIVSKIEYKVCDGSVACDLDMDALWETELRMVHNTAVDMRDKKLRREDGDVDYKMNRMPNGDITMSVTVNYIVYPSMLRAVRKVARYKNSIKTKRIDFVKE